MLSPTLAYYVVVQIAFASCQATVNLPLFSDALLLFQLHAKGKQGNGIEPSICNTSISNTWTQALPKFTGEAQLRSSPQWRKYMELVYGPELSDVVFPLDLKSFQFFYTDYLDMADLSGYPKGCSEGVKEFGDWSIAVGDVYHGIFGPLNFGSHEQSEDEKNNSFQDYLMVNLPSHQPCRDHTRVEVMHGQIHNFKTGGPRVERDYWMYKLKGTGIFYDLGLTAAATDHDGVRYDSDSVHFYARSEFGIQVYEIVDQRARAPPGTPSYVCPLAREAFSSQGKQCNCDEGHTSHALNCMR